MNENARPRELAAQIDRLLRASRVRDAQALLAGSRLSPQSADYRLLECLVLRAAGDDVRTLAATRTCRAQFPSVWQFVELELSLLVGADADAAAIDACLRDLHASGAPPTLAHDCHARVLLGRGAVGDAVLLLEQAVAADRVPLSGAVASHLMDGCFRLGRHAECLDWLERALARDPLSRCPGAKVTGALYCCHPDDLGEARLRHLRERYPDNSGLFEAHCSLLLLAGRVDALEMLLRQPPVAGGRTRLKLYRIAAAAGLAHLFPAEAGAELRAVRRRAAQLARRYPPRRATVDGFPRGQHWLHARGPEPTGTVIAFSGGNGHFGIAVRELDQYLAALGLDAVYLRDPARQYYFRGIEGVGPGPADLAALLDRLQPAMPLHGLSSSAGSLAAMALARIVPVAGLLLFGPLTFVPERYDDLPDYDHEWRILHHYCRVTYPDRIVDYRELYGAHPPRHPVHMVCGGNDVEGTCHVARMAGVANVHVQVVPDAGHTVAKWLDQRDELMAVLASRLVPAAT